MERRLGWVSIKRVGLAEDSQWLRIAGSALDVRIDWDRHIIDRIWLLGWVLHW